MEFSNESLPIIAGVIVNTGKSMADTMKYIYAVSAEDFYNVNIKDIYRLALLDVTDNSRLSNLGIRVDTREIRSLFDTPEFSRVKNIIAYSLAVRLPLLKRQIDKLSMKDKQIKQLFETVLKNGADNFGDVVFESYEDNQKLSKSRNIIPSYNSEFFRRYVYTYMPSFGEINNRNLYFLGCVEAMFPLYYSALTAHLKRILFLLQK